MIKYLRREITRLSKIRKHRVSGSIKRAPKIQLIAIAKDEAAYLSEWLFHHLHLGFDHISVYINNSSDNSWDLANKLSAESRISFYDGTEYFEQDKQSPQILIYKNAFHQAKGEYSHVMFLDIDEFFMSLNFTDDIKTLLNKMESDVCCIEWLLKIKEETEFGMPFEQTTHVQRAKQVKSIIHTSTSLKRLNPHNVYSSTASYELADGTEFILDDPSTFSLVPDEEIAKPLKPFHILHRITRSEREYIALLNRGRPIPDASKISQFKDNRGGILNPKKHECIDISTDLLQNYEKAYGEFCEKHQLNDEIEKARNKVISRYNDTIYMIENASSTDTLVLRKILRNVTDTRVMQAYQKFKQALK